MYLSEVLSIAATCVTASGWAGPPHAAAAAGPGTARWALVIFSGSRIPFFLLAQPLNRLVSSLFQSHFFHRTTATTTITYSRYHPSHTSSPPSPHLKQTHSVLIAARESALMNGRPSVFTSQVSVNPSSVLAPALPPSPCCTTAQQTSSHTKHHTSCTATLLTMACVSVIDSHNHHDLLNWLIMCVFTNMMLPTGLYLRFVALPPTGIEAEALHILTASLFSTTTFRILTLASFSFYRPLVAGSFRLKRS